MVILLNVSERFLSGLYLKHVNLSSHLSCHLPFIHLLSFSPNLIFLDVLLNCL